MEKRKYIFWFILVAVGGYFADDATGSPFERALYGIIIALMYVTLLFMYHFLINMFKKRPVTYSEGALARLEAARAAEERGGSGAHDPPKDAS